MPVQQQLQPPTFANARGYLPRPQLGEGPAPLPIQPAHGSGWGPSPGSGQPVQRGRVPQDSRPTNQLQIQRPQQPQLPHMQIQRQQQQQNYLFQPQVLGPGTALGTELLERDLCSYWAQVIQVPKWEFISCFPYFDTSHHQSLIWVIVNGK